MDGFCTSSSSTLSLSACHQLLPAPYSGPHLLCCLRAETSSFLIPATLISTMYEPPTGSHDSKAEWHSQLNQRGLFCPLPEIAFLPQPTTPPITLHHPNCLLLSVFSYLLQQDIQIMRRGLYLVGLICHCIPHAWPTVGIC